ncbi:MAG: ribulose-phosphate 3-epimerase [Firmicutes bacterium]|nr:ribulose-phosphate 3-epimerase [Bacillota bacterium]
MKITYAYFAKLEKRRSHVIKPIVSASVLAADPLHIGPQIKDTVTDNEWLHLDIMDGQFVPNISYGPGLVKSVYRQFNNTLDVHLMIAEPERFLQEFIDAGADFLTVHPESTLHLHRTLTAIRSMGARAGVALNPATPVSVLEHVLAEVDLILLMSVNPGFGGQKFIEHTYQKLEAVTSLCAQTSVAPLIAVDGGVNAINAPALRAAGVNVLVAGSALFSAEHPREYCLQLRG